MDVKMRPSCIRPILCVLLPFHFVGVAPHPDIQPNHTLMFDSVVHSNSLRNCSCAVAVHSCDESLANLLCSCGTVPRSSLPPGGLRWNDGPTAGKLTVWVREPWVLRELLNGSQVPELRLSLCASAPLDSPAQYLTLVGLRRLQVSSAKGPQHSDQALSISAGVPGQDGGLSIAFLDVWSLSRILHLKAYSVVGPPPPALVQHFPNLALSGAEEWNHHPDYIHKPSILTFIY
ncbi:exosomal polycystin-1-interacting protein-like [Brachyhypopomus gauderio]|uniref:exosomal polycystin-1-interacting protein-like n=1 Tax=Brachyhypopomus gauderio TaxID=698409 RepID=UPI00404355CF